MNRSERATIRKLVTELCANYDSQDKICLPLDSPCYMLNKWWTGAYCRYFEKAVLPVDAALESAITGEDTSMRQKICPVCGKAYLPTTSQAYCSAACRVYARRMLAGWRPEENPSGNANAGSGKTNHDMSAT